MRVSQLFLLTRIDNLHGLLQCMSYTAAVCILLYLQDGDCSNPCAGDSLRLLFTQHAQQHYSTRFQHCMTDPAFHVASPSPALITCAQPPAGNPQPMFVADDGDGTLLVEERAVLQKKLNCGSAKAAGSRPPNTRSQTPFPYYLMVGLRGHV